MRILVGDIGFRAGNSDLLLFTDEDALTAWLETRFSFFAA